MKVTSSHTIPEVELSHRCRYLEVYMTTSGPIWTKFDNLTQSSTQMTEVATAKKCNMAEVCFLNRSISALN